MKVYIAPNTGSSFYIVSREPGIDDYYSGGFDFDIETSTLACRRILQKLLPKARLPRRGTKQFLEAELTLTPTRRKLESV